MARKPRVDGLRTQAHIVCNVWNIHIRTFGGFQPAGRWEVSQEDLAEFLHIGRATAQRAIREAVAHNCLTWEQGKAGNSIYTDDKEPDEKRGKVADRYYVTKEQLINMAIRLHRYETGMIMIQDSSGCIHLGYREVAQASLDLGLVVPHEQLPTLAYTEIEGLYFTNEIEVYSDLRKEWIPLDISLYELHKTKPDNK